MVEVGPSSRRREGWSVASQRRNGLESLVLGPALTALISRPRNPYALSLSPPS